ncbi:MAG: undecaprenyl-diphosphate phosphatase [Sedimentisphaerales bacterium]|nr:undecaprenyl-diphosphate phosphatase [Sedimentisphaerales bacterium]
MDLTYLTAIIMGILQGLTEFLPVSSSGHLVMFQHLAAFNPESAEMMLFDLAVHVGTVASILYFYRKSVQKFTGGLLRDLGKLGNPATIMSESPAWRFAILALISTFATGVVYILCKKTIEAAFENPNYVSGCWLATACVLFITDRKTKHSRKIKNFTIMCALLIGIAQGIAILPGISRSGSTICACLLLGLHRRWAGEFSFLIGVIAILGATLLESIDFFSQANATLPWGPVIIGSVASGITGFLALSLLMWVVKNAKLKIFAIYLIVAAIASLVYFNIGNN